MGLRLLGRSFRMADRFPGVGSGRSGPCAGGLVLVARPAAASAVADWGLAIRGAGWPAPCENLSADHLRSGSCLIRQSVLYELAAPLLQGNIRHDAGWCGLFRYLSDAVSRGSRRRARWCDIGSRGAEREARPAAAAELLLHGCRAAVAGLFRLSSAGDDFSGYLLVRATSCDRIRQ